MIPPTTAQVLADVPGLGLIPTSTLLTTEQVAQALRYKPETIREWIWRWRDGSDRQPQLRATKLGRQWRIRAGDLSSLLEGGNRAFHTPDVQHSDSDDLQARFRAVFERSKKGRPG